MVYQIAAESREKIRIRVNGVSDTGTAIDPTGDVVQFAFTASRSTEPDVGDWVAGSWATEMIGNKKIYRAVCLLGPGGTKELAEGRWFIWIKVTDDPEVPVLFSGELQVGW